MEKNSTSNAAPLFSGEVWFDPIEAELRQRIRGFLEEMVEQEATAALGRGRYQRGAAAGYRNGTRSRRLLGSPNGSRPHQALGNRTPMSVWRDNVTHALGERAVDMTLRLDNATALPPYPQPPQQQQAA